jgi:hypothetical protein
MLLLAAMASQRYNNKMEWWMMSGFASRYGRSDGVEAKVVFPKPTFTGSLVSSVLFLL